MADQTDIRGLKDIIHLPETPWWLYLTGAALLLLGLGIWLWLRKTKQPSPEIVLLPHEAALARLDELAATSWLAEGRDKEFHFELSAVLRLYVERRFGLPASDRTIDELKREIVEVAALSPELHEELLALLSASEVVKFADVVLPQSRSRELLAGAKQFVAATIPQPEPEAKAEEQVR